MTGNITRKIKHMSNDQNYREQVAAMRQQKAQEEAAVDYNQVTYGRELALQNRQEIERQAATTADPEEREQLKEQWHYFDSEVQACENEMRRLAPPAPPDPTAVAYLKQRAPFIQKYGQQATQA